MYWISKAAKKEKVVLLIAGTLREDTHNIRFFFLVDTYLMGGGGLNGPAIKRRTFFAVSRREGVKKPDFFVDALHNKDRPSMEVI